MGSTPLKGGWKIFDPPPPWLPLGYASAKPPPLPPWLRYAKRNQGSGVRAKVQNWSQGSRNKLRLAESWLIIPFIQSFRAKLLKKQESHWKMPIFKRNVTLAENPPPPCYAMVTQHQNPPPGVT